MLDTRQIIKNLESYVSYQCYILPIHQQCDGEFKILAQGRNYLLSNSYRDLSQKLFDKPLLPAKDEFLLISGLPREMNAWYQHSDYTNFIKAPDKSLFEKAKRKSKRADEYIEDAALQWGNVLILPFLTEEY